MATWNQQGLGGLLGGIGQQNANAPQASDANATLAMIRENNDLQRSGANNVGLQAMQGLAGLHDMYQQGKAQEREKEFQGQWGQAYANGDRDSMRKLMAAYPEQAEKITSGMKGISEDVKESLGNIASGYRMAIGTGKATDYIRENADEFRRLGIDPQQAAQIANDNPKGAMELADHIGMSALGVDKYYDVKDKMEGRVIDREKLTETVRSNQVSEALTSRRDEQNNARGWAGVNIQQQNSNLARERLKLDNEIKKSDMQEKALDRRLQREKNELEREKLQQQIGEVRDKSAMAKNEKLNSVVSSLDDLNSALGVGKELESHVNEHPSVVSRNQGGVLGKLPNFTDDTKTLAAKTDEYNLKVVLPALRGVFGGNPTEGERTALMQSQNNLKNATSQDDYLRELNKSQDVIMGMQKRQIKSLGIPVTKSNDEATDVQMLLSDPSLVGEYVKTYGYLPDDYYKLKRGGK